MYTPQMMPKIKHGIDKEYLIHLVHKRPAIWDKNTDVYKDKQLKSAAWREICAILRNDFEKMDEMTSQEYVRSVIRLWSQTRDSWMRTQHGKKKGTTLRPYIYHKQLLFLQSIVPKDTKKSTAESVAENTAESITPNKESELEIEIKEEIDALEEEDDTGSGEEDDEYLVPTYSSTNEEESQEAKKRRIGEAEEFGYRDEEFVDVGETRRRIDEIDERIASYMNRRIVNSGTNVEDRHMAFFRSILPSLSLLNDDQILQFQSGVISLLQNIKRSRTFD